MDNVSILLALDLTHLGKTQSMINVRGKEVALDVKTNSQKSADYFTQNSTLLYSILDESGYKMTELKAGVMQSGEQTNLSNALVNFFSHQTQQDGAVDIKI